jgi:LCP family protein required for cell wall assembly
MQYRQEQKEKKRHINKRMIVIGLSTVGVAVLVIIALFFYRTAIDPAAAFSFAAPEPTDMLAAAAETPEPPMDYDFMKGRVNILVMGMDSNEQRLGSDREDFRTDTMLLVTVDFNTGQVDMITTPRDSYVAVTNATGQLFKANSAAYFGGGFTHSGFENACDTISDVFGGIPVDYYVGVNMDGLEALIDAMGGVEYDVDITFAGTGGEIRKGVQHLNGEQVLDYCRVRKGFGTDVDRQQRQRRILIAVFRQLADSGQIGNLPEIYRSLKDMVLTNLSFEQICALAVFATGFDGWDSIGQHTLAGEYHTAYGVYFYLLDQQAKADLVWQIFGVEIGIDKTHDLYYVLAHSKSTPRESQPPVPKDNEPPPEPTDTQPPETEPPEHEPEPNIPPDEPTNPPDEPTNPTDAPADEPDE